ncbi:hypothetical protein [Paraburkholderia caffeinilytica]|uniref:hypothetical protein n=1 Tax=Paraburkholderia caffeinilytica TaxID=1761016 RepID=UPI003DA0C6A1
MIDITSLMDRTEQLARESGIALFPGNAGTYCRLNVQTGEVEWVVTDRFGPACLPVTTLILSHFEAEKYLKKASGICTHQEL